MQVDQFPKQKTAFWQHQIKSNFIGVREFCYLKFVSVDTPLNECYIVCDKNNLLVKESPATAQNMNITLGREGLDKNS